MLKGFKAKGKSQPFIVRIVLLIIVRIVLLSLVVLIGVRGYAYYEEQQVSKEAELEMEWSIFKEANILKVGWLNKTKWMIVQYDSEDVTTIQYKNRSKLALPKKTEDNTLSAMSTVVVGKKYVATYNQEHIAPKTRRSNQSTYENWKEQRTVYFEVVLYNGGSYPKRIQLLTPDRQMMAPNYKYFLKGFTEGDEYLVIGGINTYEEEPNKVYYYLDPERGNLFMEYEIKEEYRYKAPPKVSEADHKKYYSEEVQGKADIWPAPFKQTMYLESTGDIDQPNEQNRFIQKYPEIKEYYKKDTYIKINYADHDFTQEELIEDLRSGYND